MICMMTSFQDDVNIMNKTNKNKKSNAKDIRSIKTKYYEN